VTSFIPRRNSALDAEKKKVVVIGNGMVGQRFMENLLKLDTNKDCIISTFCEEPRAAYNRVRLTAYFETRDPSSLSMTSDFDAEGRTAWYDENNVELLLNDKAVSIGTDARKVTGASGKVIDYDVAVLATGSFPFVPPIPGKQRLEFLSTALLKISRLCCRTRRTTTFNPLLSLEVVCSVLKLPKQSKTWELSLISSNLPRPSCVAKSTREVTTPWSGRLKRWA
jgi:hypothetical protein